MTDIAFYIINVNNLERRIRMKTRMEQLGITDYTWMPQSESPDEINPRDYV